MTKNNPTLITAIEMPTEAIDWQWIKLDWQEGKMSMLEIAIAHDVSSALVQRRAKQEGWGRHDPSNPSKYLQTRADAESKLETRLGDAAS